MSELTDKVQILNVRYGDVLVVRCGRPLSTAAVNGIKGVVTATLTAAGHADVPVLVLDADMSLEVVRTTPRDTRALAKDINDLQRRGLIY